MGQVRGGEELVTQRLRLGRPRAGDVGALLRIHRDPRACAHNPGDALTSWGEAEERFRGWGGHWERFGFGYWTVRWNELPDGEPLGFCGLKVMTLHGRSVLNLFYRLDPAAWGEGIASEAAGAVVGWAAANQTGRPLIARVRPGNTASLKVAARVGLVRVSAQDTDGEDGLDWIFTRNWAADDAGPPTP